MSSFRKIISDSDQLGKFISDKPLLQLATLDLTAAQIQNKIVGFGSPEKNCDETDEKGVSKLDQMKSLAATCLHQSSDKIRQILDLLVDNKEVCSDFQS